jgi:Fe-S cluster assembly iron-binding protein IscA
MAIEAKKLISKPAFFTIRIKNSFRRCYMNVKITRNAAKVLQLELDKEENKGLMVRVQVTHKHGDHAHYGLGLDDKTDNDVVVSTDKGIDVVLDKNEPLLDGIRIDYFYVPEEGFMITNPAKGNTGDH